MVSLVVWAIVMVWLASTVANQFETFSRTWVRRWDVLNVVPRWTFFAPQPGRADFHLLFRDRSGGRVTRGWTEVYPVAIRSPWTWLWNPHKRRRKAIIDLANALMRIAGDRTSTDQRHIVLSIPYLAFLNVVSRLDVGDDEKPATREFAVIATDGLLDAAPPRIIACSEPHAIEARGCHAA